MMFPKMKSRRAGVYTAPPFNAGLNVWSAPHLVEDNQLVDAENMWWEQNCLCTRPGAVATGAAEPSYVGEQRPAWEVVHTGQKVAHGNSIAELVYSRVLVLEPNQQTCAVQFHKLGDDGYIYPAATLKCSGLRGQDSTFLHVDRYPRSIFVYTDTPKAGAGVYLLCLNDRFTETDDALEQDWYSFYEFSEDFLTLLPIAKEELYTPTLLVNGRGNLSAQADLPASSYPLPQKFESLNIFTGRFQLLFTTDGVSDCFDFPVGELTEDNPTQVHLTQNGQTLTFTIGAHSDRSGVVEGIYAVLDRQKGSLRFCADGGAVYAPPRSPEANNLHISTWKSNHTDPLKWQYMCCGQWFEDAPGYTKGGNRLFLGGNLVYPGLMAWCQANTPTYFPVDNLFTVGEAGQNITTFAKQADRLIVFKEHSVYGVEYSGAGAYSLQDACAGRISKVKTDLERMTIFEVHGGIGCDCPRTVQTCFERLVWVNTDRRVYVLVTTHAFGSAQIYDLSEMIRERLLALPVGDLKTAFAINWRGKYILFAGEKQFVLNYGKQGFRYIHSYSSEQAAQRNISWYPWQVHPFSGFAKAHIAGGLFHADKCVLLACLQGDAADGRRVCQLQPLCLQGNQDTQIVWDAKAGECGFATAEIAGYLETKPYSLSKEARYKQPWQVFLGASGLGNLQVTYRAEGGPLATESLRLGGDSGAVYRLRLPAVKVQQFGLRIAGDCAFAVDGLSVHYRLLNNYK